MHTLIAATLLLSQFDMSGHVSDTSRFNMSGQTRRVRAVMLTATWCPPCAQFKKNEIPRLVQSGWKVGSSETDHLQVIDVDESNRYTARSLPTFIRLVEGKEVARYEGGLDATQFANFINPKKPANAGGDESAPTPDTEVRRVLDLLPAPKIGFVDFGCGDGRWCIAAAEKWGCRVTGVEIDPARSEATRQHIHFLGLDGLVTIVTGDATKTPVEADVGVAYLYSDVLAELQPRLQTLSAFASYLHQPPGLPVVKNGDSWFYTQSTVTTKAAIWQGQYYTQPVCNSPGCAMCKSIRQQIDMPNPPKDSIWRTLF